MHRVKKVEHVGEYKLKLTFSNHVVKIVDLESRLTKGVFLPLKNINFFKQVHIEGHSIAWPNEADFCPDVLYEMGKELVVQSKKQTSRRTSTRRKKIKAPKPSLSSG